MNSTWLQGLGACAGKPAGELQTGDVLGWNGGCTSTVAAILATTPTTITIQESWTAPGGVLLQYGQRRLKKSRIVAIVNGGKFTVAGITKDVFNLCGGAAC